MRLSQRAFEGFFSGYLRPLTVSFVLVYSVLVAGQGVASEITLDDVDDTSELRELYASGDFSPRAAVKLDGDNLVDLDLAYVEVFAAGRRVLLDGKPLDPSSYETGHRYFRGSVPGDSGSFALLSVEPSGEGTFYIDYAGSQYRGTISEQGTKLTVGQKGTAAVRETEWPATDVVEVPKREPPSGPSASQLTSPRGGATSARAEPVPALAGWYGPFALTVPAGQSYASAINRGPGVANVYVVPRGTNPVDRNSCEHTRCVITNPDAGDYDVWVYKFDSSAGEPDLPSAVNFGFGGPLLESQRGSAALASDELYSATLAFELDDGLFSQMGSVAAVNSYLAELVSYVSVTYEAEIKTRLVVGDVVLYTTSADPYSGTTTKTRLEEVRDYWRANYGSVNRALAVHLGVSPLSGGIAYLDTLCDNAWGYSVSRVDGEAPTDASQLSWDAEVLAHELGHNVASPHTHCYAGLEGNSNPVDGCYNREEGDACWTGSEELPGVGALTGGSAGAQNGTIMSYCHLLSGGLTNISRTFGSNTSFGIEANRVPTKMSRRTAEVAAASPQCLPVITNTPGVPTRPNGVSASAGDGQATVSWTAPTSNGGSAITGYTVTAAPGGATCTTTGATSCTVTGLTNGTAYTFTVTATNSSGTSSPSTASSAVTPAALDALTSGVAVSGLSGDEGSDRIFYIDVPAGAAKLTVALTVPSGDPDLYVDTTNPPPLSGFLCRSWESAGQDELCTIDAPAEGRYFVRVRGYAAYTDASLVATVAAAPGVPAIAGIVAGDGSLEVSFTAGAGAAADSYTVTCVDQSASRGALGSGSGTSLSSPHYVDDQPVAAGGRTFPSARAFHQSEIFREGSHRCATHEHDLFLRSQPGYISAERAEDCTNSQTNIDAQYDPVAGRTMVIPLYFHVIYKTDGTGYVSRARIDEQIAVLNDDFAGTNFAGNSGLATSIQFSLVAVNYVENDEWFTDAGANAPSEFKSQLVVSPERYINIYTNDAGGGGTLGYATLPPGSAGGSGDGVVMLHDTIGGRNNGYSVFDQGRTLVHEVGHYLGLRHTFRNGVCSNTYTTQDLVVDTPAQEAPDYGTSPSTACGVTSAIENFMNYSDDSAMYTFTPEQRNRMICSQTSYRPEGYSYSTPGTFTASGSSSPLTVTGLTNGTPYSCSVVATNSAGSSAASAAVVGTPKTPSAPGIPTISRTDYGDGEIYLYVTVADNGGSVITGYTATCSDGVSSYTGSSAGSPVTVAGLVNGTAYSCSVTATNAIGTSVASAATGSITPEEGVGGLPVWLLYQATQ